MSDVVFFFILFCFPLTHGWTGGKRFGPTNWNDNVVIFVYGTTPHRSLAHSLKPKNDRTTDSLSCRTLFETIGWYHHHHHTKQTPNSQPNRSCGLVFCDSIALDLNEKGIEK